MNSQDLPESESGDHVELDAPALQPVKLSSLLAAIGRQARLTDEELEMLSRLRDKTPAEPLNFDGFADAASLNQETP